MTIPTQPVDIVIVGVDPWSPEEEEDDEDEEDDDGVGGEGTVVAATGSVDWFEEQNLMSKIRIVPS